MICARRSAPDPMSSLMEALTLLLRWRRRQQTAHAPKCPGTLDQIAQRIAIEHTQECTQGFLERPPKAAGGCEDARVALWIKTFHQREALLHRSHDCAQIYRLLFSPQP